MCPISPISVKSVRLESFATGVLTVADVKVGHNWRGRKYPADPGIVLSDIRSMVSGGKTAMLRDGRCRQRTGQAGAGPVESPVRHFLRLWKHLRISIWNED